MYFDCNVAVAVDTFREEGGLRFLVCDDITESEFH